MCFTSAKNCPNNIAIRTTKLIKSRYIIVKMTYCSIDIESVASEAICKWGGGAHHVQKYFDVPPTFLLCPPHEGAQRLFVTD